MSSSTMRTAVLQATAIFTISMMLNYHLSENVFDHILENEGFLNMTNALNRSIPLPSARNTTVRQNLATGAATNTSLSLNHTAGQFNRTEMNDIFSTTKTSPKYFYSRRLPREVVIFLVISALQYWWFIWLARVLPARSRYREVANQQNDEVEENEDREEEVVKRWISQGRVQRASLNWCNTFFKWMLEMTVGRLWYRTVEHVVRMLLKLHSPKSLLEGLSKHLSYNFISSYLSIAPLANLIAFIVVPAHRQIVFIAGAELVTSIFLTTVVRAFSVWLIKTDFMQMMMRNITDNAIEIHSRQERMAAFEKFENEL